ncbi:hypothetical protein DB313_04780 (plasmid) [Borrelia turcica IST7]|uniref:Mlp family lipoprotein n=2 Tax=Borrelia turcica TaxID=229155 RepID=A0A386PPP5_9SPIR|nr:hypothetical protein DB313_04780 [Borrelia turcica IST7]
MGRVKYFVVLLILIVSCKQYDEEISKKGENNRQDKSVSEVSEEGKEEDKKTVEEALREKLSDEQKASLDFLKEALGDEGKLNKLLGLDGANVIKALENIHKQLEKCKDKNQGQKNEFKAHVKASLGGNDTNLEQLIKTESNCDAGEVGG